MDVPRGRPAAIVRPSAAEQVLTLERVPASPALSPFVDYHWYVGWQADEPHRQQVVPQPRVHVVAEGGRLLVYGVSREPFVRTLSGRGHALGASFHPGGFRPLLGRGVGGIAESVLPAEELFGLDDRPAARAVGSASEVAGMVEALESYLLPVCPEPDPVAAEVRHLVEVAERDRTVTRAEDLAARASMSLRSLQRLFTDYVGIGPKWVIARSRILDAAAAAHSGDRVDWAGLAVQLGFTDQAHLTRVFTAVVGTPPATYRRQA